MNNFSKLFLIAIISLFASNALAQSDTSLIKNEIFRQLRDENGIKIIPEYETDAVQSKTFNGNSGDHLGYSVKTAGDINADGYDDVIIGADSYSSNTGKAYIYFGGVNMNTIADVVLTGEAVTNYFGRSVSAAGDLNGDGYADVIVGAEGYNSFMGRAYIYYGGEEMNNTADVILTGEAASNLFGVSVSGAGDVNGDGYSDVIVGAQNYNFTQGRSYVYFGGPGMNNVADITMTGDAGTTAFGISVSGGGGDVNGDGFSDVIIGASGYSSNTGRAYVYFGGAVMNNVADVILTGEAMLNYFGTSVSMGGDINGDGYSDVLVGAYNYNSATGRVYIYHGAASMNSVADVTLTGEAANQFFGYSAAFAGDVNGDGFSDVIAGAYLFSSNTGKAFVFFGAVNMNTTPDVFFTGESMNNYFGRSVAAAGDVNGDGYSEVLVGAFGYSSNSGRTYLYNYFQGGEIIPELTMNGEASGNWFGVSCRTAGDVNGDGYSDIIVGAPKYNSGTGRAYIFYGGIPMNNVADVTLTGSAINNEFGYTVSSAGDVNGDGYSDVIVGAYTYSSNTGRAYIYYGGAVMNNVADVTMTGESTSSYFGISVSGGDVNGDGYSDAICGASTYNSSTGRVYVYYGGAAMNNVADVTINGELILSQFGNSVAAGDINGDGYSDVIVGAYAFDDYRGRSYIFMGGAVMNNVADEIITGEAPDDYLGGEVSCLGDLNGDGYKEFAVGAAGHDPYSKIYIYYGSQNIDNDPDLLLSGEDYHGVLGGSISDAGDMNADGFSDLLISAGTPDTVGKAMVFYGGSDMDADPDIIMRGQSAGGGFASGVSCAGDLNSDGYSDLVIGSYNYDAGKTYVYYGSNISAKPRILTVKDVSGDQGGYVNLKFMKSSYDIRGGSTGGIIYQIERSVPGISGFQWVAAGTVAGTYYSSYTTELHTPLDSGSSGNNTYFFRVTAVANSTGDIWQSNIVSGYSVDNLAPLTPVNLTGSLVIDEAHLSWNQNNENDLKQYIIYRNGIQIGVSLTLNYYDTTIISDSTYTYRIAAEDIHGNVSGQSNAVVISYSVSKFNITLIPEGFYNPLSEKLNMKDTVKAYLHSAVSPYPVVDSSVDVIDSVTFTGQFKFFNAPTGTYYLKIKHRNLIETWSKTGGENFTAGTTMNYSFTTIAAQAYGSNMKMIDNSPLRFAVYSGDVNQNGTVNLTDIVTIYNDAGIFLTGYLSTDLNGDKVVNLSDLTIAYNNSTAFVAVVKP